MRKRRRAIYAAIALLAGPACNDGSSDGGLFGDGDDGGASTDDGDDGDGDGADDGDDGGGADDGGSSDGGGSDDGGSGDDGGTTGGDTTDGGPPKLDVSFPDIGSPDGPCDPAVQDCTCKVIVGDDDAPPSDCVNEAPPDSFEPEVQWEWDGLGSITTPLVANLTDDNGDGEIDLCDTPDVVVVDGGIGAGAAAAKIFVLDGETGAEHFEIADAVEWTLTPALGDIDNDGIAEIVAGTGGVFGFNLIAFEHDGTHKWTSYDPWNYIQSLHSAIALADLDNDGDVEIIAGNHVFNHHGALSFVAPIGLTTINATTAADLDGDGDLEVVIGPAAYHHDGSEYYNNPAVPAGGVGGVFPQVANLDGDPEPEVLVAAGSGIFVLEHDGTVALEVPPAGGGSAGGLYPATIHDFDGDMVSEFALSSGTLYTAYEPDGAVTWSASVVDASGVAAGTAFDFLGDGVAEAMYADEFSMFVFDGRSGDVVLETPRSSGTSIEYPTVADVDNDGSAEIVVVSNSNPMGGKTAPSVQVIKDSQDRWIQARRIWNQHTYHVTNVREDGTIPQHEKPNWETLNTFRTNAQIEGGDVCVPPPQ